MEAYLLDWANLLLRWLHVVVGIAWIGSSFYFVLLDNSLVPPQDDVLKAKGVTGELWAVHGGGFYNPQKYAGGPQRLPTGHLHWFYWESYWTFMSGIALFALLYLWQADSFLIDRNVHAWGSPVAAGAAALAFLPVGWLVYDGICRAFGRARLGSPQAAQADQVTHAAIGGELRVGVLIFIFICAATYLACQLFAGRAAFLIIGAMLATTMTANVYFWIIPGQRTMVADLAAGRPLDPIHGQRGKQRSVHNTYFTLPVLVAMLSNHYGMTYQHAQNWLVLIGLMLVGALVRQFFVLRHKGRHAWGLVAASLVVLGALMVTMAPAPVTLAAGSTGLVPGSGTGAGSDNGPGTGSVTGSVTGAAAAMVGSVDGKMPSDFQQVQSIVAQRCAVCHNAQLASKNVRLDSSAELLRHAQQVHQQVVVLRVMPMNNATQITEAERALLGRWFLAGAKSE